MGGFRVKGHRGEAKLADASEAEMRFPSSGYIPTCQCGWTAEEPVKRIKDAVQSHKEHVLGLTTRTCNLCGEEFPKEDMPKSGNYVCRACYPDFQLASRKRRLDRDPHYMRRAHLSREYKLHIHDVDLMLLFQGNVCAVCGRDPKNSRGHHPYVDHCHETGIVRGILCQKCNQAIGLLDDNIGIIRNAANYLDRVYREAKARGAIPVDGYPHDVVPFFP